MGNIPTIAAVASGATAFSNFAAGITNLLMVTPQNTTGYQPNPVSPTTGQPLATPPSLLFHYEGENTATLESDITDHVVEDNTAVQESDCSSACHGNCSRVHWRTK